MMSESNRLLAGLVLPEGDDTTTISEGIVLQVTFPKGMRLRVNRVKRDDPDLVRLRKLIRKRLRTTNNSISRPPHFGQWLARSPVRSRPRVAQCRRRSRSSRRRARIARAARRATADPDGASVHRGRRAFAEPPTRRLGAR